MASRALGGSKQRIGTANWNAILRRAAWRSAELGGAMLLFAAMLFLALALVSYHQTDASSSTAAGGAVRNWMGASGAWAADAALTLFGLVSVLLLPLLYVFARKLWRFAEEDDGILPHADQRWWRPIAILLFAMALLGTVLSLSFSSPGGSLPASAGGVAGLLGAKAIQGAASLLPPAAGGWAILAAALVCLGAGAILAGRVFALDWGGLLTLPGALRRRPMTGDEPPRSLVPAIAKKMRPRAPPPPRSIPRASLLKSAIRRRPQSPRSSLPRPARATCSTTMPCPGSTCSPSRRPIRSRRSTSSASNATRGCWRPCSTISTSRARSRRCARARW